MMRGEMDVVIASFLECDSVSQEFNGLVGIATWTLSKEFVEEADVL